MMLRLAAAMSAPPLLVMVMVLIGAASSRRAEVPTSWAVDGETAIWLAAFPVRLSTWTPPCVLLTVKVELRAPIPRPAAGWNQTKRVQLPPAAS